MKFTKEQLLNELIKIQNEQIDELTEEEQAVLIETIESINNNEPFNMNNKGALNSIIEKSNTFKDATADELADFLDSIYNATNEKEEDEEMKTAKETVIENTDIEPNKTESDEDLPF